MALSLSDFVSHAKRRARYGDTSSNTDQAATDIILSLNFRRKRFWRAFSWDWSREAISISITSGTTDYTLGSTIGDIIILDAGGDDYLKQLTLKRYTEWFKRKGQSSGVISHYLKLGRDSSGNLQLRFWRTPSDSGTVTGFGKKRLTDYVIGDISTVTRFEFFPDETLDILLEGVLSDMAEINGDKVKAQILNAGFEKKIQDLIPEESLDPDEDIQAPPPDSVIFKRRNRGGSQVA